MSSCNHVMLQVDTLVLQGPATTGLQERGHTRKVVCKAYSDGGVKIDDPSKRLLAVSADGNESTFIDFEWLLYLDLVVTLFFYS